MLKDSGILGEGNYKVKRGEGIMNTWRLLVKHSLMIAAWESGEVLMTAASGCSAAQASAMLA